MPVAFITGCSSGLGEVFALAFAERGYRVVATMRNPQSAPSRLRALAADRPAEVAIVPLDVANPKMRKEAVDLALERFGCIDVLINNAGITARGSFEDTPETLWRAMFETNLFGPLELIRLALPLMRERRGGRIINITSVAAILKTPLLAAYCASKHALDAASAALDIETRGFGVRVVCLMPGPFKTRLAQNSLDRKSSPPYAAISAHFRAAFDAMEAKAPDDLTPVINAALAAATDPDPAIRYTAGTEAIGILPPILQSLMPLQRIGMDLTGQI
jgi:NAD(P)-dependent dehydrogenase (short-subunit alcohol dehydrogenase family)